MCFPKPKIDVCETMYLKSKKAENSTTYFSSTQRFLQLIQVKSKWVLIQNQNRKA